MFTKHPKGEDSKKLHMQVTELAWKTPPSPHLSEETVHSYIVPDLNTLSSQLSQLIVDFKNKTVV